MTTAHSLSTAAGPPPRTRGAWVGIPAWRLAGRWPAFKLSVVGSVALGAVAVVALAAATGRLGWPVLLGIAAAALSGYAVGLLSRLLAGAEEFTFCHFQIGVMAGSALVLALSGAPVLVHLDLVAVGLAVTQGVGRPGCLLAGCCYGRPARWGVRYSSAHTTAGLPSHLVGVTLLPSPLFESACLSVVAVLGGASILAGGPPGEALAIYLAGHGAGRFGLQFLRGDPARRYLLGFPESQWVALAAASVAAVLGARGHGSLRGLWIVPMAMALALAAIAARRRWEARRGRLLVHPCHVLEVTEALDRLAVRARTGAAGVHVETTSLGLRLSSGAALGPGRLQHYSLSRAGPAPLGRRQAEALARLIARARHPGAALQLVRGGHGVFHLLFRPPIRLRPWAWRSAFAP